VQAPPSPSPCSGNACNKKIDQQTVTNGEKIDALGAVNAAQLAAIQAQLASIQSQIAPTPVRVNRFVFWNKLIGRPFYVPEVVVVPANMAAQTLMIGNRTADIRARHGLAELRARLTQVMNVLSTAATLHNAAMLSANLGQTLGSIVTESVQTFAPMFGLDSEAVETFDFNDVLGKAVNETMENALGKDVWEGTKTTFTKLNRIVTTASNVVWTVQSIGDSTRSLVEFAAENTGKIGNALKKWRVVGENAYEWMPEQVDGRTATQRKLDRMIEGLSNVEEAASSISSVVGDVRSISDEVKELKEQKTEFKKAIKDLQPKKNADNQPVKDEETERKAGSVAPEISKADRDQGGDNEQ
jgi:hypothetical protein